MKYSNYSIAIIGALLLSACGGGDSNDTIPEVQTPSSTSTQSLLSSATRTLNYLVDPISRKSLYLFDKDSIKPASADTQAASLSINNCQSAQCIATWPLYDNVGVDMVTDDVFKRVGSTSQISYKGHPLYFYVDDSAEGDVKGDKLSNDTWHLVYDNFDLSSITDDTAQVSTQSRIQSYLVSSEGLALYTFDNDLVNESGTVISTCYDSCEAKWPPYRATDIDLDNLPAGIDASKFSSITRDDGSVQTVYDNEPLYHWYEDQSPNDTKGDWVNNVWHIIDIGSVEAPISVPTASISLGNDGADDYIVDSVSDNSIATIGSADPVLNLVVGTRYTVNVVNFSVHPFELLAADGSILLSMSGAINSAASFESDGAVAFSDDLSGTISFTLTQALADQATKYQCGLHTSTMFSALNITN